MFGKTISIDSHFKKNKNSSTLNILFLVFGGFGDSLVNANYIYNFAKFFGDCNHIKIDVGAKKEEIEHCKGVFKENTNKIRNIILLQKFLETVMFIYVVRIIH